jgi:hypothetical protein
MERRSQPALAMAGLLVLTIPLTWMAFASGPVPVHQRPLMTTSQIDPSTMALFRRACQNCHSENSVLPWYGRVPPGSWVLRRDVKQAMMHVNLSRWNTYRSDEQRELLTRIGSVVRNGQMPPRRYLLLHREAKLNTRERQQIYEWSRAERKRLKFAAGVSSTGVLPGTSRSQSTRGLAD